MDECNQNIHQVSSLKKGSKLNDVDDAEDDDDDDDGDDDDGAAAKLVSLIHYI